MMAKKFALTILSTIASAVCIVTGHPGTAEAMTLGFDDITNVGAGILISDGYGGLNWDNFWVRRIGYYGAGFGPGFDPGTITAPNTAYNGYAYPAEVTIDNGNFTFNSVYLTAGSSDGLNISIQGFLNNTELFSRTVIVDTQAPQLFTFDWSGINRLRFSSSGGNHGYTHFAMDNFTYNGSTTAIPTPALLPGLIGLGISVLRKRKAKTSEMQDN